MADIETIREIIGLLNHMRISKMEDSAVDSDEEVYTVLVNPESYTVDHGIERSNDQYIGANHSTYKFNKIKESTMNLSLLFDSTGSLGKVPLMPEKNVLEQINQFLKVAFYPEGKSKDSKGKDKMLKLIWGPMEFRGVLKNVSISYSHFDATGVPIRATAACTFTGGEVRFDTPPPKKSLFKKKKKDRKVPNYAKQKHAINAVVKYGTYVTIVSQQPKEAMPKSLRLVEEVAKMIIR